MVFYHHGDNVQRDTGIETATHMLSILDSPDQTSLFSVLCLCPCFLGAHKIRSHPGFPMTGFPHASTPKAASLTCLSWSSRTLELTSLHPLWSIFLRTHCIYGHLTHHDLPCHKAGVSTCMSGFPYRLRALPESFGFPDFSQALYNARIDLFM